MSELGERKKTKLPEMDSVDSGKECGSGSGDDTDRSFVCHRQMAEQDGPRISEKSYAAVRRGGI